MSKFYKVFICCIYIAIIGLSDGQCQTAESSQKSDNINLALRQTGHLLYESCGDTHSQIPAVEQVSETEFMLRLENGFDYDTLPAILDGALNNFGISDAYIVSILTCESKNIILGYNDLSFNNQVVACSSREQDELCKIIKFQIREEKPVESKAGYSMFWLLLVGVIPLIVFFINRDKVPVELITAEVTNDNLLIVGNSTFDPRSLLFSIEGSSKVLTFREGKLIEYLIRHKNEILKRQDIQDHVWEDEGVIVGRSLDVFISRLRKIIKEDSTLAIKNIHGVGYRLEESL